MSYHPQEYNRLTDLLNHKRNAVIVISGPIACGKSFLVRKACKELGMQDVYIHPDDVENFEVETTTRGLFHEGNGKVLVLDHIDTFNTERAGSLQKVLKCVKDKKTKVPVIMICFDIYAKDLRGVRTLCEREKFPILKLRKIDIQNACKSVATFAKKRKLELTQEDIRESLEFSNNDIRQAKVGIAFGGDEIDATRVSQNQMFDAARECFSQTSRAKRRRLGTTFVETDTIGTLFIHENYPAASTNLLETAEASDLLSATDVLPVHLSEIKNSLYGVVPGCCSKRVNRVQFPTIFKVLGVRERRETMTYIAQAVASRILAVQRDPEIKGKNRTESLRSIKRDMEARGVDRETVYRTSTGKQIESKVKSSFSRLKV